MTYARACNQTGVEEEKSWQGEAKGRSLHADCMESTLGCSCTCSRASIGNMSTRSQPAPTLLPYLPSSPYDPALRATPAQL